MNQSLAKPPGKQLGFGDGLKALFGGVRWIIGTPSAWGLAMVPALIALLLLVLISWGIFSLGSHLFVGRIDGALEPGVGSSVVRVVANVLWFVVSVVIGFVLSLSLALPLSAPALDAIAKKRARELGMTQFVETSIVASAWRSLRVVSMALLVGLPIILLLSIVTMVFPPAAVITLPLKFVVAAWLATWDVFDYAFGLESLGVRARFAWLSRHGMAGFAFGLALAAVALVPGLGLFVLPMGVAGSTELWIRGKSP